MTLVALDLIDENGHNIRKQAATAEQDAQLTQSIGALGVLQPVLLRRQSGDLGRFYVIAGHRRVRCARAAELTEIPAEILPPADEVTFAAIQTAENMVRVPMAAVDEWRAIVVLQEAGYTLKQAAGALGISERKAKQLDKLGHLAPEILDLIAEDQRIDLGDVATIASAPVDRQRKAFKETKGYHRTEDRIEMMARHCIGTRISRAVAIFDVAASGIFFDEDLFAEPGSDEQFTTNHIDRFIEAQKAALVESVNSRKKKGERVTLADWSARSGLVLPKGWERTWGNIKKRYPAKGDEMLFVAVREEGYGMGGIEQLAAVNRADIAAKEKAKAQAAKLKAAANRADEDEGDGNLVDDTVILDEPAEPESAVEGALSKRGQTILAGCKTDALRDHLESQPARQLPLGTLCAALVVALAGNNVAINDSSFRHGRAHFSDLAAQIVGPAGEFLELDEPQLAALATQALARMVRITDPVTGIGSGAPAEWIGAAIGADQALPRFDSADFLGCMSKAALMTLAAENGRTGLKTAGGIRQALAGSLPDWRPTSFGAPGPSVSPASAFELADDEEDEAA